MWQAYNYALNQSLLDKSYQAWPVLLPNHLKPISQSTSLPNHNFLALPPHQSTTFLTHTAHPDYPVTQKDKTILLHNGNQAEIGPLPLERKCDRHYIGQLSRLGALPLDTKF